MALFFQVTEAAVVIEEVTAEVEVVKTEVTGVVGVVPGVIIEMGVTAETAVTEAATEATIKMVDLKTVNSDPVIAAAVIVAGTAEAAGVNTIATVTNLNNLMVTEKMVTIRKKLVKLTEDKRKNTQNKTNKKVLGYSRICRTRIFRC